MLVAVSTDRAGNAKVQVQGGFRSGPVARHFGFYASGSQSGFIPMTPIGVWYRTGTAIYHLGTLPDVRAVNIKNFAKAQTVTISTDTWQVFPSSQKTTAAVADASRNQGIAYKQVT